jgi:hypothetical protein
MTEDSIVSKVVDTILKQTHEVEIQNNEKILEWIQANQQNLLQSIVYLETLKEYMLDNELTNID